MITKTMASATYGWTSDKAYEAENVNRQGREPINA